MDFSFRDIKIQAPRLSLRTLTIEDATQEYADWLNDSEVNKYLETKSGTLESVRTYIEEKRKQHDALFFGIFLNEHMHMIGTIKLEPIYIEAKKAVIAIIIGERSVWGKGYGSEAIATLVQYGFSELGLDEISLGVIADNVGAIRTYEKVGFEEVSRTLRSASSTRPSHEYVTMIITPETIRSE
jgi:ribosomal-protein-alanine N-acetyltransferase